MRIITFILILASKFAFSQATGFPISNKPTGGSLGAAVSTVDSKTAFNIGQITPGQTITIPNLTSTRSGKIIYVNDTGTVAVTLSPGGLITPGTGATYRWTGTSWSVCGIGYIPISSGDIDAVNAGTWMIGGGTTGSVILGVDTAFAASVTDVAAVQSSLNSHTSNTSNPHSVTKSQVGLGNADNTSDVNKPVSTAQAAALNLKQNVFGSQAQNSFYAAPASGSGVPSFRSIVASDVPTLNQNTTGNAATVTTNANLTGPVTSVGNATSIANSGVTAGSYILTNLIVGSDGRITAASSASFTGDISNIGTAITVAGSVVKNVVLNTPNVVFSSPVTFSTTSSTATGTLSLNTQTANTVFAGPSTGSAATPTFRSLVANDIPTIPNTKVSGLGDAALKNTGTTSGTLAAGDDLRIKGYTIINSTPNSNPADAITYYFGTNGTLAMTFGGFAADAKRVYFPKSGTITRAQVTILSGTGDGSNENASFYVRINGTTDYLLTSTAQFNGGAAGAIYWITGLSIPVVAGDYEVTKLVCPTWATNPIGANIQVNLYVE